MPEWIVGLQTCPRKGVDLHATIRHIQRAGWDELLVFGEPGTQIPNGFEGIVWPYHAGDWGGWYSGLSFLHATRPYADFYLMCEDDIVLATNVRIYVEKWINQLYPLGCLMLYTPPPHRSFRVHMVTNESSCGKNLWGAQAVVFSRNSLRKFLSSPIIINFRDSEIGKSNAHKDSLIGLWGAQEELGIFYHTPSLVQHLPVNSLIGNLPHQAEDFVGVHTDVSGWGIPALLNQPGKTITII